MFKLGNTYLALRQFTESVKFYQQCLDIEEKIGDRFSQARTYWQLGLLAEAEENYAEARVNLQTALEIFVEYEDEYNAAITRDALNRLPA